MRCLACGEEMRVVAVVPDDTMMVAGYEHRTLECPGCHEVERRLQFARESEPVAPTALPSEPDQHQSVTAPGTVAAPAGVAAPGTVAPGTVVKSTAARSTWERALDRLHSQQSYLQEREEERQAEARAAESIGRFREDWENLGRSRRQPDALVAPPVPAALPTSTISKISKPLKSFKAAVNDARAPLRTAPSSVMARATARLHRHVADRQAIDRQAMDGTSDDSKRFDELWESFAPRPQPPAPAPSPQGAAPSRSLVPIEKLEASSAWGQAMLMLRAR